MLTFKFLTTQLTTKTAATAPKMDSGLRRRAVKGVFVQDEQLRVALVVDDVEGRESEGGAAGRVHEGEVLGEGVGGEGEGGCEVDVSRRRGTVSGRWARGGFSFMKNR